MRKEEIDKLFIEGNPVISTFYITSTRHYIKNTSITSKQFQMLKERFEGRFDIKISYGGLTIHKTHYTGD